MTARPIRRPKRPTTVAGQQNGMLDRALLGPVDGNLAPSRLMEATLCAPAMAALHAAALVAGFIMWTTGRYRTLQAQWDAFGGRNARYRPCTPEEYAQRRAEDKALRRKNTTRIWTTARRNAVIVLLGPQTHPIPDETLWLLINPRSLNSATPGTSNHGDGISDDIAQLLHIDGRWVVVSIQADFLAWLCAPSTLDPELSNIEAHGYAWETEADPPHVSWWLGDQLPLALQEDDMKDALAALYKPADAWLATTRIVSPKWFVLLPDGHVRWATGPDTGYIAARGLPTLPIESDDHYHALVADWMASSVQPIDAEGHPAAST